MDTIKYKEAREYLDTHPNLKIVLNLAIDDVIKQKKNKFTSESAQSEFKELTSNGMLITNDSIGYYYLPFNTSTANAALLDYAINLLKKPLPTNPYDGMLFIQEFFDEISKPNTNRHWYTMEVERNFRNFVLMEFEEYFIVNVHEISTIYDQEHIQFSGSGYLKLYLEDVLPYFKLPIGHFFEIASNMLSREGHEYKGPEFIGKVATISHKNAIDLLNYAKLRRTPGEPLVFNIIIALSKFDLERAFEESLVLLSDPENEVEGLNCLGWLDYKNIDQINHSFNIVVEHKTENERFYLLLPRVYRNFIENEKCIDQLKTKILTKFWDLIEYPSDKVLEQVIYWLSSIKGFEDEKMKFLFAFLNKGAYVDVWDYFRHFSKPSYLFEFIKHIYATLGLKANIHPFEAALSTFERNSPKEFEEGLSELLSNEYGIIRKSGVDLLTSKRIGVYNVNLLNLSEKRQIIVTDTLLSIPYHIEKTFPIALQLRNSSYETVRVNLLNHCMHLIFAYEEIVVEILSACLNMDVDNDKDLFDKIEKNWIEYKKIIEQKKDLLEFNPFINQRAYCELYYRTEHEVQAEQMEHVHKNSQMISLGIARQINVLRGSAFTTEGNSSSISKLGKIETRMYMDKRYFINPDAYEWAFKNSILNTNYSYDEGDNS